MGGECGECGEWGVSGLMCGLRVYLFRKFDIPLLTRWMWSVLGKGLFFFSFLFFWKWSVCFIITSSSSFKVEVFFLFFLSKDFLVLLKLFFFCFLLFCFVLFCFLCVSLSLFWKTTMVFFIAFNDSKEWNYKVSGLYIYIYMICNTLYAFYKEGCILFYEWSWSTQVIYSVL